MENPLLFVIGAAFVNNVVLIKMLGVCPVVGGARRIELSLALGAATAFVLTLSAGVNHLIHHALLEPYNLLYLRILVFVLVILAAGRLAAWYLDRAYPVAFQLLGGLVPLSYINCAVLGVPLLSLQEKHSFFEALLHGFGSGLGFAIVIVVFAALRERLDVADVPRAFRGTAISMVTAGLMSLAFMGFAGLVK